MAEMLAEIFKWTKYLKAARLFIEPLLNKTTANKNP